MRELKEIEGSEIMCALAYQMTLVVGQVWLLPPRWVMFRDGDLHHMVCVGTNWLTLQKEAAPGETAVQFAPQTKAEQAVETIMRSLPLPNGWFPFDVSVRLGAGGWKGESGGPFVRSKDMAPATLVEHLTRWLGDDVMVAHQKMLDELSFLNKPWTSLLRGSTPGEGKRPLPVLAYSECVDEARQITASIEIQLYPRRRAVWEAEFSLGNYGRGYETNTVCTDHLPTLLSFLRNCPIFGVAPQPRA